MEVVRIPIVECNDDLAATGQPTGLLDVDEFRERRDQIQGAQYVQMFGEIPWADAAVERIAGQFRDAVVTERQGT